MREEKQLMVQLVQTERGKEIYVVDQQERTLDQRRPQQVEKREACRRQIDAAIEMLEQGRWEAAITLAIAAEGQAPAAPNSKLWPTLFESVKNQRGRLTEQELVNKLNEKAYWLKHATERLGEEIEISESDAWIAVARAVSKFMCAYEGVSSHMNYFAAWSGLHGFPMISKPTREHTVGEYVPLRCDSCSKTVLRKKDSPEIDYFDFHCMQCISSK